MAELFYHSVLAGLSEAGVRFVVRMKGGTGRAQDASDVEALLRLKELLRGR